MFKIGEFSKINRVTVKTLRYYEKIGLLIPYKTDEDSNYRYYSVDQLNDLSVILSLKRMGFSLAEIKKLHRNKISEKALEEKLSDLKKQLFTTNKMIEDLLHLKTKISGGQKMNEVKIKSLPEVIIASHRKIIKGYDELFYLAPQVVGPEMQRVGCVCSQPAYCFNIYHDGEYKECDIDVEICEAVTEMKEDTDILKFKKFPSVPIAATIEHKGEYEKLGESYAKIFKWIEQNGYNVIGNPRESFIDGIWNKENSEDWLTEIQVPVSK